MTNYSPPYLQCGHCNKYQTCDHCSIATQQIWAWPAAWEPSPARGVTVKAGTPERGTERGTEIKHGK